MIPYGRQSIEPDDIQAVMDVLQSDYLTTGPMVAEFEQAICDFTGAKFAVAVANGTAALHASVYAAGIGEEVEVITTPMTFAATSNAVIYQNGIPVFADVCPDSLLIDPEDVKRKITPKTKAIIAVDYTGQPCDYDALRAIADERGLALISDACHSIGGSYKDRNVGTLADMTCLSFHPVKHITTGEGGMILTDDEILAGKLQLFRNHGITTDHRQRTESGSWFYEMTDLGYNYRISDIQCALGKSQLKKLAPWIVRRQQIAARYNQVFSDNDKVTPLTVSENVSSAFHLYVIKLADGINRNDVFSKLRDVGIGVNVHYIPVHQHPYYRKELGMGAGMCPVAEAAYEQIISLPMFPTLSDADQDTVIESLDSILAG